MAQIEAGYDVGVELVTVGDVQLDEHAGALLQAVREATVNAAKHAGGQVSVYVECDTEAVRVYVRDRGPGFDPDAVPAP